MENKTTSVAPSASNTIILASSNKKKLAELSRILNHHHFLLKPQSELGVGDAIEDGLSFVENAIKKARHACRETGLPSISDDSGIEVDFLKGQPGIYSARFAGENASDQQNLDKLLDELNDVPPAQRTARYQCVIVYMNHAEDPTPIICQSSWEGVLLTEKRGEGGFGYDPIFYCPATQKTAAQMLPEEKSSISHRGKALKKLAAYFSSVAG
jgi:XTP/dITP diphosphohydrolase